MGAAFLSAIGKRHAAVYFRACSRYSEGVMPVSFLKVVQKLLSLVNPVLKQIFLMEESEERSKNLALLMRVVII